MHKVEDNMVRRDDVQWCLTILLQTELCCRNGRKRQHMLQEDEKNKRTQFTLLVTEI